MRALLEPSPWQAGLSRSRWWVAGLRPAVSWLSDGGLAPVQRTLASFQVVYRRGRPAVHAPDWEDPSKVHRIQPITW